MSQMSNYLEKALLDHVLRGGSAYTQPAGVYLALFTAVTDGEAGTVTEVSTSGSAYIRKAITFAAATSGAGSTSNSADVTFDVATTNWGTITAVGIYDAVSTGNLLFYGNLSAAKTINSGDQFVVKSGQLTVTLA